MTYGEIAYGEIVLPANCSPVRAVPCWSAHARASGSYNPSRPIITIMRPHRSRVVSRLKPVIIAVVAAGDDVEENWEETPELSLFPAGVGVLVDRRGVSVPVFVGVVAGMVDGVVGGVVVRLGAPWAPSSSSLLAASVELEVDGKISLVRHHSIARSSGGGRGCVEGNHHTIHQQRNDQTGGGTVADCTTGVRGSQVWVACEVDLRRPRGCRKSGDAHLDVDVGRSEAFPKRVPARYERLETVLTTSFAPHAPPAPQLVVIFVLTLEVCRPHLDKRARDVPAEPIRHHAADLDTAAPVGGSQHVPKGRVGLEKGALHILCRGRRKRWAVGAEGARHQGHHHSRGPWCHRVLSTQ